MKLTENKFLSTLEKARRLSVESQKLIDSLLNNPNLENDLESVFFQGTNETNLASCLMCYVMYGEEPLSRNMRDFWLTYKNQLKANDN